MRRPSSGSLMPGGPHAETLQPDWAQDAGRAAATPSKPRDKWDMIPNAVGQEGAKKPLLTRGGQEAKRRKGEQIHQQQLLVPQWPACSSDQY